MEVTSDIQVYTFLDDILENYQEYKGKHHTFSAKLKRYHNPNRTKTPYLVLDSDCSNEVRVNLSRKEYAKWEYYLKTAQSLIINAEPYFNPYFGGVCFKQSEILKVR